MTARRLVLAFALAAGLTTPCFANEPGHPKSHPGLRYRIYAFRLYYYGPTAVLPPNPAPWYMWWPADANETLSAHDFQSSPYPTWPTDPAAAAMPTAVPTVRPQGPVTYIPSPMPFQPVNYMRPQVPPYWYGAYGR